MGSVIVLIIVAFVVYKIWQKWKEEERKKKEAQEREEAQKREEAEILRKQQEEEQWQEDIKTGKVNLSVAVKFHNKGTKLLEAGKYNEAIEQFTKAIDSNPRYKDAYCNRGIAYKKKGNCDQAIADYYQGLRLDYEDADIHYNLGLAYFEKKEFRHAVDAFGAMRSHLGSVAKSKKVMMLLDHGIANINCGMQENNYSHFHNAYRIFEEVLSIDPNNSNARKLLETAQQKLPYAMDSRL